MAGILPPTEKIGAAYKQSLYQARSVVTAIGLYPTGIPKTLQYSTLIMLSAYNPGGRLKFEGWNVRMMEQLKRCLSQYDYFTGKGSLKDVSEPLFMVNMPVQKAIVIARRFRQNAIVIVRFQRRSKLLFLA